MAFRIEQWEYKGTQLLVTIYQDRADTLQVKMGKYTKVVTEKFQTINIAPYLREWLNIEQPIISGKYTDYDAAVPVEVTINGELIESGSSYTLGEYAGEIVQCASDLPYRVIAHGQTDVVTVYLDAYNSADITANNQQIESVQHSGISTLVAMAIQPTTDQINVSRYLDDNSTSYSQDIRYIFRPMGMNGKRIAWLNRYGAVDFWNFDYLREQSFGATAETIYTHNGYKKIARTAEKVFVMETREATREALDALSFIIASPAVWIVNDDLTGNPTFEEVDVITEECKVFDSQELIGLQIAYRPKKRVL